MTKKKSISLYLMDGDAAGRIKCILANWTGLVYKIPHTALGESKDRDDLKKSGVYFLFGDSGQTKKPVVYIGQAGTRKNGNGILERLQEDRRTKDYWTEAIAFTTSNNSFGPTEICYLENRFCKLAQAAQRYDVKNLNEPTPGNITEEKESELEEFVDNARLIMGVLGYKVFEPVVPKYDKTQPEAETDEQPEMYLTCTIKKYGFTAKGKGRPTGEGFVVLRGSVIAPEEDHNIPFTVKRQRQSAKIDENHVLLEDMLFKKPSSAAVFVTGKIQNGRIKWKTADGQTLKALESEKGKADKARS